MTLGTAALFAIFVSQSNDFALGYPILEAVYSKTHPDYLRYIYLIAPISLCILNPIAFFMMEANEVLAENRPANQQSASSYLVVDHSNNKLSDNDTADDSDTPDSEFERNSNTLHSPDRLSNTSSNNHHHHHQRTINNIDELDQIRSVSDPVVTNSTTISSPDFSRLIETDRQANRGEPRELSTWTLTKKTVLATISNPIVFMTMIGLASSFLLKRQIPALIDPILLALSNTFSAIALFYLGFTMVGKIRNLKFASICIIMVLIFTKSIIYPLITRELVLHLNEAQHEQQQTPEEVESLSTFGFLYGTFPTAPSLFFYITRFKAIGGDDLISSALVFGTLASAPLMMISGEHFFLIIISLSLSFN